MTDHIRATLDDFRARRAAIDNVIVALEVVLGIVPAVPVVPAVLGPPAGARKPHKPARKAEKPATTLARTPGASTVAPFIARRDAILAALRRSDGLATSKVLRAAMPKEPHLNAEQQDDAYRNTMTKLKAQGVVGRTGDTWSLTERREA